MRGSRVLTVVGVAGVVGALAWLPSQAGDGQLVGMWQMDEPPDASVSVDSSGNGLDGTIGDTVQTGVTYAGGPVAYRFPYNVIETSPAQPERLVQVGDDPRLDPGTGSYAVTIRYRTVSDDPNLIQKGQSATPGGYWKLQAPGGVLQCVWRGSEGSGSVSSGVPLNNAEWHTVTCARTPTQLSITVDDQVVDTQDVALGEIDNNWPVTIGGKASCDGKDVDCDFFMGRIDFVRITAG